MSVLSFTCDIFAAEKYGIWRERTEITESYEELVTGAVLSAEWPDGVWCSGHTKVAPGGPPILTLSPRLTPKLEFWMGKGTRSLLQRPLPPSLQPFPSRGGHCPNASTSHLGLAKPVLTVGGGGRRHTQRQEHSPLTGTQWPEDWLADWARYR